MEQLTLDLQVEYLGTALPPAIISPVTLSQLNKLKRKVFTFDTSEADERAFKQEIANYLQGNAEQTLTKTLWGIVWERNEKGKYGKYTFFNESSQKVYLDWDFFKWATIICSILNVELAKADSLKAD